MVSVSWCSSESTFPADESVTYPPGASEQEKTCCQSTHTAIAMSVHQRTVHSYHDNLHTWSTCAEGWLLNCFSNGSRYKSHSLCIVETSNLIFYCSQYRHTWGKVSLKFTASNTIYPHTVGKIVSERDPSLKRSVSSRHHRADSPFPIPAVRPAWGSSVPWGHQVAPLVLQIMPAHSHEEIAPTPLGQETKNHPALRATRNDHCNAEYSLWTLYI